MRELPKDSISCHALSHKAPKNVFIDGLVHFLALGKEFEMNDVLKTLSIFRILFSVQQ